MSTYNQLYYKHKHLQLRPKHKPCVLVIDDDPFATILLKKVLFKIEARVFTAHHETDATPLIHKFAFDMIILDWKLCQIDANILLREMDLYLKAQTNIKKPISTVIFTSQPSHNISIPELNHLKVIDYWRKPMTNSQIISRALQIMDW